MINVEKNIKLSDHSTFKIGGPAKEFAVVENENELVETLNYAKENNLKFFILGGGSNVLFDDKGFDGIIIKISAQGGPASGWQNTSLEIWAGDSLSSLVGAAKDNSLSGMEWASGIPGTIGGAVQGNCGAFGGEMAEVIETVKVYDISQQKIVNYKSEDCNFSYRSSIFKQNSNLIIVSVKIKLEKCKKEKIEEKTKEILNKRLEKQPKGWIGSVGSFFKNPVIESEDLRKKYENETKNKIVEKKIPAGWLIDEVGFKGKKVGNVAVSDKNANFILNLGGGKAEEIMMLASIIKSKVRNQFGVQLEEEIKYVAY